MSHFLRFKPFICAAQYIKNIDVSLTRVATLMSLNLKFSLDYYAACSSVIQLEKFSIFNFFQEMILVLCGLLYTITLTL